MMAKVRIRERARARWRRRGVTLVEVLIVVAIMALIAGGVGFMVLPKYREAQVKRAGTQARAIRAVATQYVALHGGDCPTVDQLIAEKQLDSENRNDPWGKTFAIQCSADDIFVTSTGPDGNAGSEDDITVPQDTGAGEE